LSWKLPPENALEPFGHLDERVEVDPRLDALTVEEVDQILRADVAGRPRREGAAADPADRRVEHGRAGFDRGPRVRDPGVARVVQMHADRNAQRAAFADDLPHLP